MSREIPNPEAAEILEQEEGRDVKVSAIFERHGEKEASATSAETPLTEKGERESAEFGRSLPKSGVVKGYSSNTPRTRRTAELAVENSPTEVKMTETGTEKPKIRTDKGLGFYYDPEGEFFKKAKQISKDVVEKDFGDLSPEEEKNRKLTEIRNQQANYYLSFGDKRPDPFTISPVELAALMAEKVNTYINMADRLNSGSDVQLVNATHDFNIAAFLKEVMVLSRKEDGQPVKFEKIEEIGGGIGYNESFEVLTETDSQGNKTIKLIFRGKEYELDTKRLFELVEIAKKFDFESVK